MIVVVLIFTSWNNTQIKRLNQVNVKEYEANFFPEADDLYLPNYDTDKLNSNFVNEYIDINERIDKSNQSLHVYDIKQEGPVVTLNIENVSFEDQDFTVPLIAYPYVVSIDKTNNRYLNTDIDDNNAQLKVTIPSNFNGEIESKFIKPWYWTASEFISFLGVIFIVGMIIFDKNHKSKKVY